MVTTGEMVQPSQQHVAPCVKGIEWGLTPNRTESPWGRTLIQPVASV